MTRTLSLRPLVSHRYLVYVGGLGVIVGMRLTPVPEPVRVGVMTLVLAVMVLTFAGEQWEDDEDGVAQPTLLGLGVVGVVAGLALVLSEVIAGLLFLAGGLLFVKRGITGGAGP